MHIQRSVLLFFLLTAFLSGCGSNAGMDDTGMPETMEEAETAEDNRTPTEADGSNADMAETYERFLNGELTIAWKKEQVPVAELFWDNDIEYCFCDINGDGVEELHIRDSVAYYAVGVCDNQPQILSEIWWWHEPEASDAEWLKKLSENDLEWKERQLENFATWQEAYAAYIERRESMVSEYASYALIYVDDDEIPELYIYTGGMATGEFVVSFYDGHVGVMNRERVGLQYMERVGLLYSESGNMGFNPCNIYKLDKGTFSEIGTGLCSEIYDEEEVSFEYFWEGCPVTENEYEARIAELIDKSACVELAELYTKEEILEILGDYGE